MGYIVISCVRVHIVSSHRIFSLDPTREQKCTNYADQRYKLGMIGEKELRLATSPLALRSSRDLFTLRELEEGRELARVDV